MKTTHSGIIETAKARIVEPIKGTGNCRPMQFHPAARKRPGVSPVSSIKLIPERASTTTQVLHEIHLLRNEAHSHWGLNE
jgi:hypothetical protein